LRLWNRLLYLVFVRITYCILMYLKRADERKEEALKLPHNHHRNEAIVKKLGESMRCIDRGEGSNPALSATCLNAESPGEIRVQTNNQTLKGFLKPSKARTKGGLQGLRIRPHTAQIAPG
jgi:hypothetical protein